MTPEGKVKKEIKAYLDSIGAYHFWPVQTGYGAATLDCLASINGMFVAVEVKAPGKRPTQRQQNNIGFILERGGAAFWCDSLKQFKENLECYVV